MTFKPLAICALTVFHIAAIASGLLIPIDEISWIYAAAAITCGLFLGVVIGLKGDNKSRLPITIGIIQAYLMSMLFFGIVGARAVFNSYVLENFQTLLLSPGVFLFFYFYVVLLMKWWKLFKRI